MAPPRCSCAYRLYHFNACLSEGGAACSRRGEPHGRRRTAELDKEAVVAGYLGSGVDRTSLPPELRDDPLCVLGFEEDGDLQVSPVPPVPSPARPLTSLSGASLS